MALVTVSSKRDLWVEAIRAGLARAPISLELSQTYMPMDDTWSFVAVATSDIARVDPGKKPIVVRVPLNRETMTPEQAVKLIFVECRMSGLC